MRYRDVLPVPMLLAVLLSAGCGDAPPPPRDVTVSALTAETAAVPGRTLTLGWRFRIAEGWHLYGDHRNDSGLPPTVTLELPDGWTADPPRRPPAERHVAPGGILDHVYRGEAVLLQTVTVDPHARPGETAELRARISWLACREACVPGDTLLTVTMPVAAHADPGPGSTPLTHAFRALPRPAGDAVVARWDGAVLLVSAAGADSLEFHPDPACGPLVDAVADGAASGSDLALRFRPRDGAAGPAEGVLRVASPDGAVRHLTLDEPAVPIADPEQGDRP